MNGLDAVLGGIERTALELRSLYADCGYSLYRMSKFEEYDFYARNKDFLTSKGIITFTDADGRLMALKPDVTLSIIKNSRVGEGKMRKLCYDENVYRAAKDAPFREIKQVGLECIGEVGDENVAEVLLLAAKSLKKISDDAVLDVSHLGLLSALIEGVDGEARERLIDSIAGKKRQELETVCGELGIDAERRELLLALASADGRLDGMLAMLASLPSPDGITESTEQLAAVLAAFEANGLADMLRFDLSIVSDMNYYDGIVFKGFVGGVPGGILSGGRYDKLMRRMGHGAGAIGFAVYLDMIERLVEGGEKTDAPAMINVALPKGRLGEKVYRMFADAGYDCPAILEDSRKLVFDNEAAGVRYFWVKPSDVAIYVERGAADIGVVGKDILLESEPDVYELLDLGLGKCRMAVAGPKDFREDARHTLRVATKFANVAQKHYASVGRDIDIIHLNGSIEIAPILGLSDVIVDIVETGTTLRENDLEVKEIITEISARLIANRASFRFKGDAIKKIVRELSEQKE